MGEVYRARDPRFGRDVAIKVLPASFSEDADRLRRFEQEARSAGALNHPNVVAVFDLGTHDGAPYLVQELLEGETLRAALSGGRLPQRRAVDYAVQIAQGLAAAHEKGIVHRDLKPENLFLTRDGRVKILDFGLAKLTQAEAGGNATELPTATRGTEPGVVLGTLGYMSPEQVRGRPTDARGDIFSFGAILYEMLSGQRAFRGDSAADTMSAILREDPPDLSATNQNVSPGLERIVRHCLEKAPEQRFHSAHDLAFDLAALSTVTAPGAAADARTRRRARPLALAAAAAALLSAAAFWAGRTSSAGGAATSVRHERITFRRGNVLHARFTPDGQTVVYSAAWGGRPAEIFLSRIGTPETRPLGIEGANLLSISSTGELAILLKKGNLFGTVGSGTLARLPLAGGTPRQVAEDVERADWSPDGASLAVTRRAGAGTALEFPLGKRLYATAEDLGNPRVSPDGKSIAVIESRSLVVLDLAGTRRILTSDWIFIDSIVWHPSGREVWLSGVSKFGVAGIFAADLRGRLRLVAPTTDLEVLHDIARDGSVLVEREIGSRQIYFSRAAGQETDLSWLENSAAAALSEDGKTLLFSESAEGGGPKGAVYLRATDGSPAVRLGDGFAQALSPDGRWALTMVREEQGRRLVLLPTASGEARTLRTGSLELVGADFVGNDRILLGARDKGRGLRGYILDLPDGTPRAFTPEGLTDGAAISPDGTLVAANDPERRVQLYPIDGGAPRPVAGLEPGDVPIQWSSDGGSLYVTRYDQAPLPVYRIDLASGRKVLWRELLPADRSGIVRIDRVLVTRDGSACAYSLNRVTDSDLFRVTGWR